MARARSRQKMHVHQTITVIVGEDTRLMATGNLSHAPVGHDVYGEQKIALDLAIADTYNRRKYNAIRVWHS